MMDRNTIFAMEPSALVAYLEATLRLAEVPLHVRSCVPTETGAVAARDFRNSWGRKRDAIYSVDGSVGTINVRGMITRGPDLKSDWYGEPYVMHGEIADAADKLAADSRVDRVVLSVDSPGGVALGTSESYGALSSLANAKPMVAHTDGMMASGALWLSMAAQKIYATSDAMIGSIGAVAMLADISEMLAKYGIKYEVFRSAPLKAAGSGLEPLTQEQRAYFQTSIEELATNFKGVVAAGRKLTPEAVQKIADGGVYRTPTAIQQGLIDGIATASQVVTQLSGTYAGGVPRIQESTGAEVPQMADSTTDSRTAAPAPAEEKAQVAEGTKAESPPSPATLAELKTLPGVTDSFIVETMGKGLTFAQASLGWMAALSSDNKALREQVNTKLESKTESKVGANESVGFVASESTVSGEDAWKAEFAAKPQLQKEFGTAANYVAYKRVESAGRVIFVNKG